MEEARENLEVAGERQAEIARLLAERQADLRKYEEERRAIRGRPSTARANRAKKIVKDINALEAGRLPSDEFEPIAPRSPGSLTAGARANAQHHADPAPLPRGAPPAAGGGSSSAAAGDGAGTGGGDDDAVDDDAEDDDAEDPAFKHFYRVPPHQREYNKAETTAWLKAARKGGTVRKTPKIEPPNLLTNGCQPEHIGLGALHVHAPHLSHGLALPPCPVHGWASVDQGKVHSRGQCPARRIYCEQGDEWVSGVQLTCDMCENMKKKAQEDLEELKQYGFYEEEELAAAELKATQTTYVYRSYNPQSLLLYAERYSFYVRSLPYVILNKRMAMSKLVAKRISRSCAHALEILYIAPAYK